MKRRLAYTMSVVGIGASICAVPAVSAQAQPTTRWGCHASVTSNGRPGGGVSGYCLYGSGNYRVVGLCINIFTKSSWWIYGNWTSDGISYKTCPWYAYPGPYPFMQS